MNIPQRENQTAWTNGLRQASAICSDNNATAGDALKRNDSETFVTTRGDDHDPVCVKQYTQIMTMLWTHKCHLPCQTKNSCLFSQSSFLRTGANDREARSMPL